MHSTESYCIEWGPSAAWLPDNVAGASPTADQSFLTTMDHSLGVVVGVGVLQQDVCTCATIELNQNVGIEA